MAHRPATVLEPTKIALLRKALTVAPMSLNLTGLSMYPAIRAGDRCRVSAVDPSTLRIGDIILTTRDSRLFAHRIVTVEPGPPRRWIMKGDTLLWPDPPVSPEDILGQVIGLERGDRYIDLRAPARRMAGRVFAALSGPFSQAFMRTLMLRRRMLAKMADRADVRARRRTHAESLSVRPATDVDVSDVAMLFGEQQIANAPLNGVDMERMHALARNMLDGARASGSTLWLVELNDTVVGHAVIGPLGDGELQAPGWWVMSVYVKMTARGYGAAEAMVRAGLREAAERGESCVRYAAYASNQASVRLALKLGFEPDDTEPARQYADYYRKADPDGAPPEVFRSDLKDVSNNQGASPNSARHGETTH